MKKRLLSCVRPNPKTTFGIHNPSGIHNLFQLRVGLSELRSHKKHHNFLDTPSDTCLCKQGKEDTSHFLLHCTFYTTHREVLSNCALDILRKNQITNVNDLVNLYLYGHPSLNIIDNRSILTTTIEFNQSTTLAYLNRN